MIYEMTFRCKILLFSYIFEYGDHMILKDMHLLENYGELSKNT